jgi:hypothetical protein
MLVNFPVSVFGRNHFSSIVMSLFVVDRSMAIDVIFYVNWILNLLSMEI